MLLNHSDNSFDLIEKLATNEECVAKLYEGYASAFPSLREFWTYLTTEEMKHASWIRNLGEKTNQVFIEENRFNNTAIHTFTNYLHKELTKLNEQEIPIIEALSITFYIEQSLIESKFFEIFETDSAEVKHILTNIRNDTLTHHKKAKEQMEKYRNSR